ncbi:ABC transporter type 1, transmembrane domain-containing protein [Catenaria anguillulae PL171]|uniref:ABC transporter type 1, transmembrane domain-containing protein n=1 Tax=Catenaria anguillulae PL171 TaxID=765915 RepID=A0A1Y2HKA9_9FUNG|nr:ABC transporter type 1, transmembrane domain-containing protein [Catenaria anguillulae PL171]
MAILFLGLNVLETVLYGQGYHNIFVEQIRIKAALQNLIYRKGLHLPSGTGGDGFRDSSSDSDKSPQHLTHAAAETNHGEILNLATVDTQSICNGLWSLAEILTAPIAVLVAMYLLYRQVGWATVVALVILLSLLPFMSLFAHRMHHHRSLMLAQTDARIKLTTETVAAIKTLKLYAWVGMMRDKILGLRSQELVHMKSLQAIMACQVVMSFVMPSIATAGTIAIASLTSEQNSMTSSKVFVVLSVMRMLNQFLETVVWGWNPVVEAHVAQQRIRKFLLAQELRSYVTYEVRGRESKKMGHEAEEVIETEDVNAVHISNAKFGFSGTKEVLQVDNLKIKRGYLSAIVGSVGSGKTALIQAIIGEMVKLNPEGSVRVFVQRA